MAFGNFWSKLRNLSTRYRLTGQAPGKRSNAVCRAYIQHWLKTEKEIPNQSAARIFAAATSILKAGTPAAGSH
jgi:hypothetical protein